MRLDPLLCVYRRSRFICNFYLTVLYVCLSKCDYYIFNHWSKGFKQTGMVDYRLPP